MRAEGACAAPRLLIADVGRWLVFFVAIAPLFCFYPQVQLRE